jgi:hypothetical protein
LYNEDKERVMEVVGGVAFLLVLLGFIVFWVWSLVDAIRVPDDSAFRAGTKTIWVGRDRGHGADRLGRVHGHGPAAAGVGRGAGG